MNRNEVFVAPLSTPLNPSGFLFFWTLPVSLGVPLQAADQATPLNMIDDAVDNMYDGCRDKVAETVNKMYFAKENKGIFAEAWKKATKCTNDNLKNKSEEDKALTKDHMQAICVYTAHRCKFYELFNNHVLRNRSIYGTNFPFHYLHFRLTSAIQILNNNTKSHTSYHRTKHEFTGEVGQIMGFGLFASSSYNKTLISFGNRTCFAIKTCYGSYLKNYSSFGDKEQEVLIPPYEKFNITKKETGPFTTGLVGCEVVYTMESLGVVSNLNCKNGSLSPLNQASGFFWTVTIILLLIDGNSCDLYSMCVSLV